MQVRNKCETGVQIPLAGGACKFEPGETKDIPEAVARKLNPKHFELLGDMPKKKRGEA